MISLLLTSSGGTSPIQITGSNLRFTNATFYGYSSFTPSGTPVNNANTVYVGPESGKLAVKVTAGNFVDYKLPMKGPEHLTNFWFLANSGDGLYVIAYQAQ